MEDEAVRMEDVYKRQVLMFSLLFLSEIRIPSFDAAMTRFRVPIHTVSYTHLDVYKRQVIGKIGLIFMFGLYTLRISEERYLKVDSFI